MMFIRKVYRQCDVSGCRNKNCYAVSGYREFGNSIIVCEDCIKEILNIVHNADFESKKVVSSADVAAKSVVPEKESVAEPKIIPDTATEAVPEPKAITDTAEPEADKPKAKPKTRVRKAAEKK